MLLQSRFPVALPFAGSLNVPIGKMRINKTFIDRTTRMMREMEV